MEVLPTPWSPRKTSLYFASGDILGIDDAVDDGIEPVIPSDIADQKYLIKMHELI